MSIHNQFSFIYFIAFTVILLAVNLLIIKFQKRDWREFFNWKSILLALVFTFLGLFYTEISSSGDWNEKNFGFPRSFYIEKVSKNSSAFVKFEIFRIHYFNFLQKRILYFPIILENWIEPNDEKYRRKTQLKTNIKQIVGL